LRQARLERWSQQDSFVHRRHAAAKVMVTLALLLAIATLTEHTPVICGVYFALLIAVTVAARVPPSAVLIRAGAILPFALTFALVSAIAGEPGRAAMLIVRGYLSAFAAVLLMSTTPMPDLLAGLEWLRVPRFLLQVIQFLYRYLTVLMTEAGLMRQASLARAGRIRMLKFRQAAGAAGVLFARSWARAQAIHRAMISRGFDGHMPVFSRPRFGMADAGFAVGAAILIAGMRVAFQ
jgi:cobalt/nickel transport system permease protein